jgi:hypothetical protein
MFEYMSDCSTNFTFIFRHFYLKPFSTLLRPAMRSEQNKILFLSNRHQISTDMNATIHYFNISPRTVELLSFEELVLTFYITM